MNYNRYYYLKFIECLRIELHVCIRFIVYKVYKELERIIRTSSVKFSVDKVLEIAKIIATIDIKNDGVAVVSKRTLFLTEEQMAIKHKRPAQQLG